MAKLNTSTSVVDYLKSTGGDSSYGARAKLAENYGISGYTGSASQNIQLMSYLQGGGDSKAGLNSIINSDQNAVADSLRASDAPPVRTSAADKYKSPTDIVDYKAPDAPNFEKIYSDLRKSYGVTDMESTLNQLNLQAREIQAEKRTRVAGEEGKPVAMNVIAGRVSETERQENERLDVVLRESEYYSNQVKNSYAVIDTIMKIKDMDYDNAKESYDSVFDKTMKVLQYGQDLEDRELSREQQATDNARANLQIIYNNLTSGDSDFSTLSSADLTTIAKLEVQSGLPQGFVQTLKNTNPAAEIISSSSRQEANGSKYTDIVMRNKDGSLSVQSVYLGAERLPANASGSDPKMTEAETGREARSRVSSYLSARTGADGYVSPTDFVAARNAWTSDGFSRVDFDAEYKSYVNPTQRSEVGLSF